MSSEVSNLLSSDGEAHIKKLTPSLSSKLLVQLFSAVLYGSTAVAMNFVNKAALLEFPLSNVLLLNQMLLALLVLPLLRALGYLSFPAITRQKAITLLPVTVLYVTNVAFALVSLSTLNVVFYSTLKRLTPMIVLVIKATTRKQWPPREITLSVALVVGGCIIAGIGDFEFDLKGYSFALASCCLQASYLLLVEHSGEAKSVDTSELMLYNAIWTVPCMLMVVLLTGEAQQIAATVTAGSQKHGALAFLTMLVGCGLFGMLLNFSQFLCTMHNSALTTTIVGVLKGVVATALGFALFGGVQAGVLNLTGISVNTVGGMWYGVAKYRQTQAQAAAKGRIVP